MLPKTTEKYKYIICDVCEYKQTTSSEITRDINRQLMLSGFIYNGTISSCCLFSKQYTKETVAVVGYEISGKDKSVVKLLECVKETNNPDIVICCNSGWGKLTNKEKLSNLSEYRTILYGGFYEEATSGNEIMYSKVNARRICDLVKVLLGYSV